MILERLERAWDALTRDQQRIVALVVGGFVLTVVVYVLTSAIIALLVAVGIAYTIGRSRAKHRPEPQASASEPAKKPEQPGRPPAQHPARPRAQTPLGRLFSERPAWNGTPVGPFEPPRRTPPTEQEPYDSA